MSWGASFRAIIGWMLHKFTCVKPINLVRIWDDVLTGGQSAYQFIWSWMINDLSIYNSMSSELIRLTFLKFSSQFSSFIMFWLRQWIHMWTRIKCCHYFSYTIFTAEVLNWKRCHAKDTHTWLCWAQLNLIKVWPESHLIGVHFPRIIE